jgi:hypothetical protein
MLDARLTIFRPQRSGRGDGPSSGRSAVSTMGRSGVTIAVPSLLFRRGERPPISAGYRELDRVSRGGDVQQWYGTCFVCYMDTRKQQQALPSNPKGLDWRRPVQKDLIGLFDELAAFNERIAELTKQGHQSHAMDVLKAQAIRFAAQIDELRCILIVPKQ